MSSTSLIPSSPRVLVGERSILEIQPADLIPAPLKQTAVELVGRAEVFEIVGNKLAADSAGALVNDLQKFAKAAEDATKESCKPMKAAIAKQEAALDILLTDTGIMRELKRLKELLSAFMAIEAKRAEEERKRQAAETKRLQEEKAELERKAKELADKLERERLAKIEAEAKAKREAEAKAESERKKAAEEAARLKREREETERRGTLEQQRKAREAEELAAKKRKEEEDARIKAENEAADKAAAEKIKAEAESKRAQDMLNLQQAELNSKIQEASAPVTAAKVAGVTGKFDWIIRPEDESSEEAIQECMAKAYAVHPEWFKLSPRLADIKAALKRDETLKVDGLVFAKNFGVRST